MLKKEKGTELKPKKDKVKWNLPGLTAHEKVILNNKNTWIFFHSQSVDTWIYHGWILGRMCRNNTFIKNHLAKLTGS